MNALLDARRAQLSDLSYSNPISGELPYLGPRFAASQIVSPGILIVIAVATLYAVYG